MKKLNCALLVDDDEINNFINESLIKRLNITDNIVKVKNGIDALKFITSYHESEQCPELILLDLYMPVIDGFEFLSSFRSLQFENKECINLVVLSSSHNPADEKRLKEEFNVSNYFIKPLTDEKLINLLQSSQISN
ncbi:MAG: response regulator [Cytophagaceae bacterium]